MSKRTIYTTVEVAKICKVAPRTVSKWFDSGRLRGYRIPGSQDRRIPREYLIRFLAEHDLPLGGLDEADEEDRQMELFRQYQLDHPGDDLSFEEFCSGEGHDGC